jgi:CII-binding regulator of phage lambda lysogenization HflD
LSVLKDISNYYSAKVCNIGVTYAVEQVKSLMRKGEANTTAWNTTLKKIITASTKLLFLLTVTKGCPFSRC